MAQGDDDGEEMVNGKRKENNLGSAGYLKWATGKPSTKTKKHQK